jgi:hydroxyacylglutathione hydrolase
MTVIHQIKLKISNCYLVEGEGKILVDSGSPREGKTIVQALKNYGVELSDLSLILHTHGHSDHCGSTSELIQMHKIPTAIHVEDSHMTENGKNDFLKTTRFVARFIRPFVDKPFPSFKPDVCVNDQDDLKKYGIDGKIYLTKGHTDGSISIEFENSEAIIGDVMMGGFMGGTFFPHLPDYHYFANNMEEINQSIHKILGFKADKFYVEHGGPLDRKRIERRFR